MRRDATAEGDSDARVHEGPPADGKLPLIEGRHFTLRGVVVGLVVGLIICFSNMYFGLQTGWVR